MLRVVGQSRRACDRISRRELIRVGGLSLFAGMNLPLALSAAERGGANGYGPGLGNGKAKAVILLNLFGGPPHLDMFDLKPQAPANVRGQFKPIATAVPGVQICELLPKIAGIMDRASLIRTYSHRYNSHNPYNVLTGFDGGNDRENYFAKRTDHPSIASVLQHVRERTEPAGGNGRQAGSLSHDRQAVVPQYVMMPAFPGYTQALRRAGPYGGYLGSQYDPLFTQFEPKLSRKSKGDYDAVPAMGEPRPPSLAALPELTADRLDRRRTLLSQFDEQLAQVERTGVTQRMSALKRKAFSLLSSSQTRAAFDISRESDATRDKYGRNVWGSSMLIARRLVEAGSTFVTVNWESKGANHWDLHENNFGMLKSHLPQLDQLTAAIVTDLQERGLLDQTLVIVMGEMGRSPTVNAKAGRDHWPQCGFSLLFGGGTKRGFVLGKTDRKAAYPVERPVSAGDLAATIYQLLGVNPHETVKDLSGRPVHIAHGGSPVLELMS